MRKREYEVMFNLEDYSWWSVGLRELVFSYIDKFNQHTHSPAILDAGCGTGALLDGCRMNNSYGLELSEEAIKYCKQRALTNLVRGTVSSVPCKSGSFDFVICLDTLYHAWIDDDVKSLEEFYRVLNKNGKLLLNLPAYNFLRSKHDEAVYTKHRYTIKDTRHRVKKAGFEIEKITYRNTILFPLAVVKRMKEKLFYLNAKSTESELEGMPVMLNKTFTRILSLENRLINAGFILPFGLSVFCIARKRSGRDIECNIKT